MVTFEQAKKAASVLYHTSRFRPPATSGIGVGKSGPNHVVNVYFAGPQPAEPLPTKVEGVEVLYRFDVGEIQFVNDNDGDYED